MNKGQIISFIILCLIKAFLYAEDSEHICLFSHGIADSHKQAFSYITSPLQTHPFLITTPFITFDYPDVSNSIFRINRTQTSLAQDNEIDCLAYVFFEKISTRKVILIGVSRGASTAINFMAQYNPENVSALILESPFDCVESIICYMAHETMLSWIPGIKKCGSSLMSYIFCKYNTEGIRPIDSVPFIRPDLPILIICSISDSRVPVWSSLNIYSLLRKTGHENTFLLILPQGFHGQLIKHPISGYLYQNIAHAFYQKFNLPHRKEYADQGIMLLSKSQPTDQELEQYYPSYCRSKNISSSRKKVCRSR